MLRARLAASMPSVDHAAHSRDDLGLAPISGTEQYRARPSGAGQCEQPRIVQIGGNDCPLVLRGPHDDFRVGCPIW
jgi:hypothetical protein